MSLKDGSRSENFDETSCFSGKKRKAIFVSEWGLAHHKGPKVHNCSNIWPSSFNFQFRTHQPVPGVCNHIRQLLSISKFYSGFRLRSRDCWLWELSDMLHSIPNCLIWFSNSKNAINPQKKFISFQEKGWLLIARFWIFLIIYWIGKDFFSL